MNDRTLLYRQVHPSWVQHGRPSSQTFKPTPKDNKRLSVYDGDMITPSRAWEHYTSHLGLASVGVVSVTVSECTALELYVISDPIPFPEHAIIDFSEYSASAAEKKAKKLAHLANARGCCHRPDPAP
ncbi:conserved hypothetical protein [Kyrpidia tusciae DSM 2912]|uniref:Uncharacterized protein n=1 Tax=Kyrpidia tusciae (strain DSM 2912 / NBRC 15312 / T2) TaxID=562970 RepID=D5WV55_KYRT2|nr:conserved hypothetical protein [Kyrpidia tusciae DSM 2912]